MELIPLNNPSQQKLNNAQIEQIQKQKQEYYLLGSYLRTKGLKLFQYNPKNEKVEEADIRFNETIELVPVDGKLIPVDLENQRCEVDSRNIYFEALNLKNALRRVKRYKKGQIELFNLKKPANKTIDVYKAI